MTLVRKLVVAASSLGLAALGVLVAGAVNTAEALTLPTGTTLTVTVPTVVPPTVTVPPVTTALPPPPVVTTVLPPVTTVVPPVRPPTPTIVVPPPPPPVATVTTRVPPTPTAPVVTQVPTQPTIPAPARAPVATSTVPLRSPGDSTAPAEAVAETPASGEGSGVVVGSSGSSAAPTAKGLPASAAQAEAARRSFVGSVRAERPGLVRGRKGAPGVITFTFRVPRRGTVVVTVTQVAPSCRVVGTFEVRARPGVNRARWSGRIDGRLLPPGTYRLAPRLVRSGTSAAEPLPAALRGVPVVILPSQASPRLLEDRSALARLRSRNVCRWEVGNDDRSELVGAPFAVDLASLARPATVAGTGGEGGSEPDVPASDGSSAESGGVLGAVATPFVGGGGSRFASAVLLLLLVPALVLLTLAAVPRQALLRGPTAALARRQDDFVLLGLGWVLVWGLYIGLVYALSVILE